jgi:DNA-binding HxlR family transcriptional regulator
MEQEVTKKLPVPRCSVIAALKVFSTKWKPCILCYLSEQPMRYNQLHRIIPNISRRMLSEHLKQLEKDQLITRISFDKKNQHVEYSLSEKGRSLVPLLEALQNWGLRHLDGVVSIREMLEFQGALAERA